MTTGLTIRNHFCSNKMSGHY